MFEQRFISTSQQIASLRQFFRSQRSQPSALGDARRQQARTGGRLSSLLGLTSAPCSEWDETQWSETRQDLHDD